MIGGLATLFGADRLARARLGDQPLGGSELVVGPVSNPRSRGSCCTAPCSIIRSWPSAITPVAAHWCSRPNKARTPPASRTPRAGAIWNAASAPCARAVNATSRPAQRCARRSSNCWSMVERHAARPAGILRILCAMSSARTRCALLLALCTLAPGVLDAAVSELGRRQFTCKTGELSLVGDRGHVRYAPGSYQVVRIPTALGLLRYTCKSIRGVVTCPLDTTAVTVKATSFQAASTYAAWASDTRRAARWRVARGADAGAAAGPE